MYKIALMTIGRIKTPWIAEGCSMYLERLRHSFDLEERVFTSGNQKEEQENMLNALGKIEGTIVILDERGKEFTSPAFSGWLSRERDLGTHVVFVIGGAYGLNDAIRKKGKLVLSLGKMTFPHELSKLLFLEQLFRAESMRKGSGYHH